MKNKTIWKEFYEAAIAFRDLKPWQWMYDTDIFGVEDPESGEIGYCCIMGNAGEVFALGLYPGLEGYKTYLSLAYLPDDLPFSDYTAIGLNQRMIKVEFVDREELGKPDLDLIKALGLRFRGKRQWVIARDFQPGFFPWYLTAEQARRLTHALWQSIGVAKRYKETKEVLPEGELMLIRRPEMKGTDIRWKDEIKKNGPVTIQPFPSKPPSPERVKKAKQKLKKVEAAWLYSLHYHKSPVKDDNYDRPYFPKLGLFINYGNGMMTGFYLMEPENQLEQIEKSLFEEFHKTEMIPSQIGVDSIMAFRALAPSAEALGIEMILAPDEPIFEEVKKTFDEYMG